MNLFDDLNDRQLAAVKTIDGPVLVLAGAGSGKTKTLTHRIAYLISEGYANQQQILAVTFTNKAAREMRQRIADLLSQNNNYHFMPWMGTFHGICVKILRQSGQEIGIDPKFVIYDDSDRQKLIKQAMDNLSISVKSIKPKALSSLISKAKNQLISADDYSFDNYNPIERTVAQIYPEYEKLRQKAKALDFDDLLVEVVRLLKTKPEIRQYWQDKFKYILVDEYQDTNQAQYQIIKLLVNNQQNLCVVGDDNQSIYKWRGADFTNILNFKQHFPQAKIIKLEQNYRSTGNILRSAQKLIEKNQQRSDKTIWTEAEDGAEVLIYDSPNEIFEAKRVVDLISQAKLNGISYQQMAVLYRTNAQSYQLERALLQAKIPHQIIGGVRFFDRKEIKDIIAYLKLLYQPNDRVAFERIINLPLRGIGASSINKFLSWWQTTNYDLLTAIAKINQSNLSKPIQRKFSKFGQLMVKISEFYQTNPPLDQLINQIIDLIHYKDYLDRDPLEKDSRLENLSALVSESKIYSDLATFLEDTSLLSSGDQVETDQKVNLMTVHSAKGLEFDLVIIVGLEEGIFPHSRAYNQADEMEEERRLCYVAMTRAKQFLYLSYAHSRMTFGQTKSNLPSQFLHDAELLEQIDYTPQTEDFVPDIINEFEIGDRVESVQFGIGTVVDIDGLAVSVRFTDHKIRKLNIEYANLVKI